MTQWLEVLNYDLSSLSFYLAFTDSVPRKCQCVCTLCTIVHVKLIKSLLLPSRWWKRSMFVIKCISCNLLLFRFSRHNSNVCSWFQCQHQWHVDDLWQMTPNAWIRWKNIYKWCWAKCVSVISCAWPQLVCPVHACLCLFVCDWMCVERCSK